MYEDLRGGGIEFTSFLYYKLRFIYAKNGVGDGDEGREDGLEREIYIYT